MLLKIEGITLRVLAVMCLVGVAACTQNEPLREPPTDVQELARSFECPIGQTPTCERRTTSHYQCYCADKETMKAILDPDRK